MEFAINFDGPEKAYAANIPQRGMGTTDVKAIKKAVFIKTGKKIPIKDICCTSESIKRDITVYVSLEMAEKIHHFESMSQIDVKVKENALNKFYKEEFNEDYDGSESVQIRPALNEDLLLLAWKRAGCPLEWDICEAKTKKIPMMDVHGQENSNECVIFAGNKEGFERLIDILSEAIERKGNADRTLFNGKKEEYNILLSFDLNEVK